MCANLAFQKGTKKLNKSSLLNSASLFSNFDNKIEKATINEESTMSGDYPIEVQNYNNTSLLTTTNNTMNQKSMSTTNLFDVIILKLF